METPIGTNNKKSSSSDEISTISTGSQMLTIAAQGCSHGELDRIYQDVLDFQQKTGKSLDVLFLCGDLQCVRDLFDLQCVAVPPKYRKLNTFHQYVTGEKVAPVMTVFVGGNHEASNILQSLYYGGFVAPKIYFLGFAGVIRYKGLRIAGASGIFNEKHYGMAHFESPPYTADTLRSIYHLRQLEVFRLKHLILTETPIDIFLSHDWPQDIWEYGDKAQLLRTKPYFQEDIATRKLGSPPLKELLAALQPSFWFAAHLHVKFPAVVVHTNDRNPKTTRFLALDKVIPNRGYIQFLSIPTSCMHGGDKDLHFDAEWITILRKTHHKLLSSESRNLSDDLIEPPTSEEVDHVRDLLKINYGESLTIPNLDPQPIRCGNLEQGNHQTDLFLSTLQLPHIWTVPSSQPVKLESIEIDPNEIDI